MASRPSLPEWIQPMAATLTQDRFTGDGWTFERKLDGIRLIAFKDGADIRLYSRTRNLQTLPFIAEAVARLPARTAILDGELTWDEHAYHVFDLIWLDGEDLTGLPLSERRRRLATLPLRAPLLPVPPLTDAEPWTRACREGWEGVIAKRLDSPYEQRRSKHWLKMKCELQQDFVVGGFTDPTGGRIGLGALLVGYFDGADFVFAGKVGTGFDTKLLTDLRALLGAAEVARPPFTRGSGLPRVRQHWVRPKIVVRVAFIEWTRYDKLRHPRVLTVREAVQARDGKRTTGRQ